ncbi:hypothetical protein B0H16DRAFT_1475331 [Mycena metata]|uniref:Uncharacterized protein n=1 Tax=Mycena metata TaxID=1033252 RepID=A0AAD7MIC5_9AGAR|nr:hypothetical protein B0H16DRAFT_1475331 [Mycena metata]
MNLDFLFYRPVGHNWATESVVTLLSWLEVIAFTFTPRRQGLIDIWEDYDFMLLCDFLWCHESPKWLGKNGRPTRVSVDRDILRLLYACKVTAINNRPERGNPLFTTCYLLGISWDKLRAAFRSLRGILGRDVTQPTNRTWIVDERALATFDTSSILAELAKGCVCHIRAMVRGPIDLTAFPKIAPDWGFFLRASPPPGLLNSLHEVGEALDYREPCWVFGVWPPDVHNALQCLKTLSPIPMELVNRLERKLGDKNRGRMEEEWMKWRVQCRAYSKHLTIC